MDHNHRHDTSEPRLRDKIRDDLHHTGFFHRIHLDFEDIRDFYVTEEKRSQLDAMPWYKKWFILIFWLLKSMLLKLTPARRLLVIIASVMMLSNDFVIHSENSVVVIDWHIPGLGIFIFLLMLELKDRILARSELAEGRGVQKALMPEEFPQFAGWSVMVHSEPANEVGGDLVDFIPANGTEAAVVLGDVSGKGLKAAIMMAKLQTTIRVLQFDQPDATFPMEKLNKIFRRESVPGMFASLLFGKISSANSTIRYINAGHLPPLLLTAQGVQELPKGDAALGIVDNPEYSEQSISLDPGDTFIAFSDGVVEAQNILKDQFGIERLKKFLSSVSSQPAGEIGRKLMTDVAIFVGEARPHDDLSFVIIKKI